MLSSLVLLAAVWLIGIPLFVIGCLWACERWENRTARSLDRIWNLPAREPGLGGDTERGRVV